jgi:thiol-disulfide isomerase/thioredoxin
VRKIETLSKQSSALTLSLIASLLALAACSPAGDGREGASSSTIEIVGFSELDAKLLASRGEGQLVNFWAMWCSPCVAELPELVEAAHAYRDQGGRLVGISYDLMVAGSDPATIVDDTRDFLEARELELEVLIYDEPDYEAINERFALPGEVPVTLAINKDGEIVDRHNGRAGKERFEEMMRKALGL